MRRQQSIEHLETAANAAHQRREWRLERCGWVAMLVLVLAALAGFLGPGPLSSRTISNADCSLTIDYCAVEHYEAPGRLVIRAQTADTDMFRLVVSRSFCDHAMAESIVPRPISIEARNDDVVYTFAVTPSAPTSVLYCYKYGDSAVFDHRIAIDGGESITFRQYVLP